MLDLFSTDVRGLVNIPFCPVLEANDLTFDGKFWMEWEDFRYVMGNLDGKSWENYGKTVEMYLGMVVQTWDMRLLILPVASKVM